MTPAFTHARIHAPQRAEGGPADAVEIVDENLALVAHGEGREVGGAVQHDVFHVDGGHACVCVCVCVCGCGCVVVGWLGGGGFLHEYTQTHMYTYVW